MNRHVRKRCYEYICYSQQKKFSANTRNSLYARGMPKLLRTAIILVSAMIGSAALIAGLIIIVENLTVYGNSPADFLPTEETIAVLHDIDQQMFTQDKADFPSLEGIPFATGSTVAILRMSDGTQEAVSFELSTKGTFGPFAVTVSNPEVSSLLQKQNVSPLGRDASYKLLQGAHDKTPWRYIATDAIPHSNGLWEEMEYALLYGGTDFIGTQEIDHRRTISSKKLQDIRTSIPESAARLPHSIVRISLASPVAVWERIQKSLSAKQQIVLEGMERRYVQQWGDDISILDIHALMKQPSTFHITASGGVMHFAIEGSENDLTKREHTLDRIHNSFAKTLPSSRITKRVLDQRFNSTDIRYDQTQITQEVEKDGDWTIRGTRTTEDPDGVFTATNGKRFIMSDNKETLKAVIHTQEAQQTAQQNGYIYAIGEIDQEGLQNWTATFLQAKDRTSLLREFPNTLFWQTIINGSVQQIILQK